MKLLYFHWYLGVIVDCWMFPLWPWYTKQLRELADVCSWAVSPQSSYRFIYLFIHLFIPSRWKTKKIVFFFCCIFNLIVAQAKLSKYKWYIIKLEEIYKICVVVGWSRKELPRICFCYICFFFWVSSESRGGIKMVVLGHYLRERRWQWRTANTEKLLFSSHGVLINE